MNWLDFDGQRPRSVAANQSHVNAVPWEHWGNFLMWNKCLLGIKWLTLDGLKSKVEVTVTSCPSYSYEPDFSGKFWGHFFKIGTYVHLDSGTRSLWPTQYKPFDFVDIERHVIPIAPCDQVFLLIATYVMSLDKHKCKLQYSEVFIILFK